MPRRDLIRPAIVKTTRQDKQYYQITTRNIIYIQKTMSFFLKKNLNNIGFIIKVLIFALRKVNNAT